MRRAKCIGKSSLTKNLWYEEPEQLDSGSGGALSQGAGHDGSFCDSIIPYNTFRTARTRVSRNLKLSCPWEILRSA